MRLSAECFAAACGGSRLDRWPKSVVTSGRGRPMPTTWRIFAPYRIPGWVTAAGDSVTQKASISQTYTTRSVSLTVRCGGSYARTEVMVIVVQVIYFAMARILRASVSATIDRGINEVFDYVSSLATMDGWVVGRSLTFKLNILRMGEARFLWKNRTEPDDYRTLSGQDGQ